MSTGFATPVHPADRAAVACIRCAVDRYWHLDSPAASDDDCVAACVAAATAVVTADWHETRAIVSALLRCADECDSVGSDVGTMSPDEYADCSRWCRELADQLAAAPVRLP